MNRDHVAKIWLFRGLSDLFFAFDSDSPVFEDNVRFSEIMGLEKFLKAVLLYQRHTEYEAHPQDMKREELNKIAMGYGHKFEAMLKALIHAGLIDIEQIKQNSYGRYKGEQLVYALEKGYMETRYPVPTPVSDRFPIEDTDFSNDPLSSSSMTKFIYALCNACFFELSRTVDFTDMLHQFREKFQHRESFSRFCNCFWEARCKQ